MTISRESTAERIADVLRRRITEGDLRPGTQLSEERLVARLGVSRNTLREAFRLLAHDGLLIHRRHRGVFVPELDEDDLIDLYRLWRTVECDVVRSLNGLDVDRLRPLRADVEAAESAASRGEWGEVATANMRFHQCLVSLAGSRRIDDVTRRLLAEMRLAFHVVASPRGCTSGTSAATTPCSTCWRTARSSGPPTSWSDTSTTPRNSCWRPTAAGATTARHAT